MLVNANANVTSTAGTGITATTAGGAATVGQLAGSTITGATDAIRVDNTVGGAINVNALGTLIANNGSGVFVGTNAASADPINVTTNIVRSTGGPGTWGSQVRASAGTGDITITSNGVMSSAGAPGSMFGGILAATTGTSNRNVTINVNADIGSPTDRSPAAQVLVNGTSSSARTLAVNVANASIFGLPAAVQVTQSATSLGDIRIIGTGTGTLSATGPTGIGINARILNAANPGNILVDVTQSVLGTVQGINATTLGTGTVTVAARGNVTATTGAGITAATLGTTLVTIGAGTTTTGVQGVNLQGTAGNSLIVNGTLRNADGTTPYTVLAGGPFTLTLGAAGTIVGPLAFTTGNDTFNNQGTFAAPTLLDFGAGTDSFANSGVLNVNANTTLAGLETFTNSGRINLNTFTLTGPAVAFNNTGTIDTNGSATLAGFTSFSNAGTLDLAAGTFTVPAAPFVNTGTILADEGAATITGQTSFANSGTLDLQDGAVGDVLTINSAFAGAAGSNLLLDFDGATADRLVINGAAGGSTTVNANFLGGSLINLDGVLVADTASTAANAFVLGTVGGDTPLVDFSLVQEGADFFLISAPNAAAFNPLVVPGFAADLWYQSADEVFAETRKPATTIGFSFWGNGYISKDKYGDDNDSVTIEGVGFDVDRELETKRAGIQARRRLRVCRNRPSGSDRRIRMGRGRRQRRCRPEGRWLEYRRLRRIWRPDRLPCRIPRQA